MGWKQFIASIIGSVAWPLVAVYGLWLIRNKLDLLFQRPLRSIETPLGKVIFETGLEAGKETVKKIENQTEGAAAPPIDARPEGEALSLEDQKKLALSSVVIAFQDIEQELLTARQLLGMKSIYGAEFTMEVLRDRQLVTDDVAKLFKILRQSRDFIAHGMVNNVSAEEAGSYYIQSSIVLESVRQAIAKLRSAK